MDTDQQLNVGSVPVLAGHQERPVNRSLNLPGDWQTLLGAGGGRLLVDLTRGLTRGSSRGWVSLLGWGIFAAIGLFVTVAAMFDIAQPQDEGQLLVYPWLMAHGAMPYRDIFITYPPGAFLILAALFKAGLPALATERILGGLARLAFIVVVNRSLTGSWLRFSWIGVPVAFALISSSGMALTAIPWMVGLPIFLLALLSLRDRPALGAALFFLAATFRYEFGIAGLIALAVLALLRRPEPRTRRWTGPLPAAAALALGLLLFYGGLSLIASGAALRDIFYTPAFVIAPGRRLPLHPYHFGALNVPLAALTLAAPPLVLLAALWFGRPYLLATNLAVLTSLSQFLQRADAWHLFPVAALVMSWTVLSLRDLVETPSTGPRLAAPRFLRERRSGPRAMLLASLALLAIGLIVGGRYTVRAAAYNVGSFKRTTSGPSLLVSAGGRTIVAANAVEARDDAQVARFFDRHASVPAVFIAPRTLRHTMANMTSLYYLLGIRPASAYLEMDPGLEADAAVQREIIRELGGRAWVILWNGGYWYEPNASQRAGSPLLARYIDGHYQEEMRNSTYEVLAPRGG